MALIDENKITSFEGEFEFLSNFADSPIKVAGKMWPTVEHAFQAWRTSSMFAQEIIRRAATPGKAKRLGRKAPFKKDWDSFKESLMWCFVSLKFRRNTKLAEQLIATGNRTIVEGNNWHDNTWGDCTCPECKDIKGQNLLGNILMTVRDQMKK